MHNFYNILHHENITTYQLGLFMYCFHYKLLPSNFDNYFCQGISIHKYNTMYSCHYRSYPARTKVMQFSVKCSGPKVLNTLPQELIQAPTLTSLTLTWNTTYCPRSFNLFVWFFYVSFCTELFEFIAQDLKWLCSLYTALIVFFHRIWSDLKKDKLWIVNKTFELIF